MIYIITGDINSGKSGYLLSLYHSNKTGDGFYNRKIFSGSTYIGQEMIHLSTGLTCPFSYLTHNIPEHWDELFAYQDYSFSRTGIQFCKDIINNIKSNSQPAFIDEIGPLELQEKGLFLEFRELLHTEKDIYVVIRNRCLPDVLSKFEIKNYQILRI